MKRGQWRRWRRILTAVYSIAAIAGLHNYILLFAPTTIVGILALLYTPAKGDQPPESLRYAWPALLFIAGFFITPQQTAVYGAICCAGGLLLETFYRRVAATIPFILLLLSPIAAGYIDNFSFPIRLQLSAIAGHLLARAPVFSVDHANEGLHMLVISLLAALLLINYCQTQYRRSLQVLPILLLLIMAAVLNIIANLFRIICLGVLAIVPADPLHHVLGLVFLLAFIVLPLLPLTRRTILRWGVPEPENNIRPARSPTLLVSNIAITAAVLLIVGLHFPHLLRVKIW